MATGNYYKDVYNTKISETTSISNNKYQYIDHGPQNSFYNGKQNTMEHKIAFKHTGVICIY